MSGVDLNKKLLENDKGQAHIGRDSLRNNMLPNCVVMNKDLKLRCHSCKDKKERPYFTCYNHETCKRCFCIDCLKTKFGINPTKPEFDNWVCLVCQHKCNCSKCIKKIHLSLGSNQNGLPLDNPITAFAKSSENDPDVLVVKPWRKTSFLCSERKFRGPKHYKRSIINDNHQEDDDICRENLSDSKAALIPANKRKTKVRKRPFQKHNPKKFKQGQEPLKRPLKESSSDDLLEESLDLSRVSAKGPPVKTLIRSEAVVNPPKTTAFDGILKLNSLNPYSSFRYDVTQHISNVSHETNGNQ